MKRIILGVTGSSCAPDAVLLANKLTENGYAVDVILTKAAQRFVSADRFMTATRRIVYTDSSLERTSPEAHYLTLAKDADLALVAPATANTIAKLAAGITDNLLTLTLAALDDVPVMICPAARDRLYRNQIAQRNRRELENLGYYFFDALRESDRLLERVGDMLDPECWGAYI